jgi:peptidoglycan/LPS O-acetylase OafA/YrhL
MLKYGNLFFAGILFYNIKMHGSNIKRHLLILLCFITEFFTRYNGNYDYLSFVDHFIISFIYFGVFYLLIFNKLGFLVNKVLIFLGTISYSLYLVHQNMGYEIIKKLYEYTSNPYLIIIIPTCIAIVIAIGITYLVEKPALSYIRNKYKGVKAKPYLQRT